MRSRPLLFLLLSGLALLCRHSTLFAADKVTTREALKPFNLLVGSWKGSGLPEGTREEKQKGFWQETVAWDWRFKGEVAWLRVKFTTGKFYTSGELHYLPDDAKYKLTLQTVDKQTHEFVGTFQDARLTVDRLDAGKKETQRLVFSLLHANRHLYRYETKPEGRSDYTKHYQVGATKEGEDFASGTGAPECIVTGGAGTMSVSYKGVNYYVCCSGCRDAFKDNPEKFIKEFEEKKAKKK